MKVKIGEKIYDSNKTPIMLILDEDDKSLISSMGEQTKYAVFPETAEYDSVESRVGFMMVKIEAEQ